VGVCAFPFLLPTDVFRLPLFTSRRGHLHYVVYMCRGVLVSGVRMCRWFCVRTDFFTNLYQKIQNKHVWTTVTTSLQANITNSNFGTDKKRIILRSSYLYLVSARCRQLNGYVLRKSSAGLPRSIAMRQSVTFCVDRKIPSKVPHMRASRNVPQTVNSAFVLLARGPRPAQQQRKTTISLCRSGWVQRHRYKLSLFLLQD